MVLPLYYDIMALFVREQEHMAGPLAAAERRERVQAPALTGAQQTVVQPAFHSLTHISRDLNLAFIFGYYINSISNGLVIRIRSKVAADDVGFFRSLLGSSENQSIVIRVVEFTNSPTFPSSF